ncbi:MAG: hypothetical protein A2X81_19905 [Desulfobacterales bacterium GWB2_56_26]|nr:MAG: hypothetical protein A2X81_19905 [Desulfobacterales bacterium GWB2_56_26]
MIGHDPLIEIIIPNWNGEGMLNHCLQSLRQQTFSDFAVTVVDNGSHDGSIELMERQFPEVRLIKLDHNTGFSVAVNTGIEAAKAPWLLLLNNDMEVAPDCLEKLCLAVAQYPEYDFFALKMMNFHQREYIDGAGDAVLRGGVGYRLGTMEKDGEGYCHDRETFGACAGAALYSRGMLARVGLFDSDFFAYLEDVDLNMRARRLGSRCMFLASALVYHIGSASSGSKINELTVRLSTRNNIYVLFKNYSWGLLLRFLPAIAVYQTAWLLFCLKKGMLAPYLSGLCQAMSTLPGLLKKRGKMPAHDPAIPVKRFAAMIRSAEREAVCSIMARRTAAGKGNFLLNLYCTLLL